jgi:hypothetical protein
MIGYCALAGLLALVVASALRAGSIPPAWRAVVALLPVLPMVAFFVGVARWLRTLDEMQRLIHLEAMLIQFAATGILVLGYGMLANSGTVPDIPFSRAWGPLWAAVFWFWAVGLVLVRRKYR